MIETTHEKKRRNFKPPTNYTTQIELVGQNGRWLFEVVAFFKKTAEIFADGLQKRRPIETPNSDPNPPWYKWQVCRFAR